MVAAGVSLNVSTDGADRSLTDLGSGERGTALPRVVVVNKLPLLEVLRAGLVLIGLGVGGYLLWRVQDVLFLLTLAILLSTAIEPLVNRLRRGPFSRGSGVLVVYTVIVVVIGLPAYVIVPSVASQAASFSETLPDRLQQLRPYAENLPRPVQGIAVGFLDNAFQAVQAPPRPAGDDIVQAGATAAHTLVSFFSVFVLAYYWLVERASLKRVILRTVPVRHARGVNTVWMEVEEKLGGWVRGQLILMLAVGVMATLGYVVLGLPNPILLGVAAGLLEIIPMLGPFLAFAPAVLVALAVDPTRALFVLAYALVIQQLEGNVLVPRVLGRTVGVSPLTVLLGILVGSTLAGLPGAFLAVPLAGAVQVLLAHLLHSEDSSQADEHHEPQDRAVHQGGQPPRAAAA
ncbi:MAG TPA: AI-2E family transporter [Chloroflexota bacterium]|nr:AI-2E family transporter [Chloroflexota bacterium]